MKFLSSTNELFGRTVIRPEGSIHIAKTPTVGNWQDSAVPGVDVWDLYIQANVPNAAARQTYFSMYEYSQGGTVPASSPCVVWRQDGTSTGLLEQSVDGINWTPMSPVAGEVKMRMGNKNIPSGWLELNGQSIPNANTTYPALWAATPAMWKSGTTLNLPNMAQAFPQGTTSTASGIPTTGTNQYLLTEDQVPLRNHQHFTPDWTANIRSHIDNAIVRTGSTADIGGSGSGLSVLGGGDSASRTVNPGTNLSPPTSATMVGGVFFGNIPSSWNGGILSGAAGAPATSLVNNVPKSVTAHYIIKT